MERIYNRAIVDELERRAIDPPFDFRDDLQVEWAGHPNWFFRLSKFSLPYLQHPAVPRAQFLDRVDRVENPERYVLKPLFSFAGLGVVVGPSAAEIDAVPPERRGQYLLQERVVFRAGDRHPGGQGQDRGAHHVYLARRNEGGEHHCAHGGGAPQMGVDHNKNLEWVGGRRGFWHDDSLHVQL
ncbi:MAG: hypothetical protein WDO73_34205 [Ignavibacteriota bacterium]